MQALRTREPPAAIPMTVEEAKQRLIDAGRILEAEGQGDLTRGHVSVRVPGDAARFFMKPHSFGFDEITMENIVVCDLEGEKVGGGGRRHRGVHPLRDLQGAPGCEQRHSRASDLCGGVVRDRPCGASDQPAGIAVQGRRALLHRIDQSHPL